MMYRMCESPLFPPTSDPTAARSISSTSGLGQAVQPSQAEISQYCWMVPDFKAKRHQEKTKCKKTRRYGRLMKMPDSLNSLSYSFSKTWSFEAFSHDRRGRPLTSVKASKRHVYVLREPYRCSLIFSVNGPVGTWAETLSRRIRLRNLWNPAVKPQESASCRQLRPYHTHGHVCTCRCSPKSSPAQDIPKNPHWINDNIWK